MGDGDLRPVRTIPLPGVVEELHPIVMWCSTEQDEPRSILVIDERPPLASGWRVERRDLGPLSGERGGAQEKQQPEYRGGEMKVETDQL